MKLLLATSIALAVSAALDGKSTVDFLTKSNRTMVEGNPFLVWLYGTDRPSTKQVAFGGAAIIFAEIGIAFGASHFWHPAAYLFAIQQGGQASAHVYEYFRNERILADCPKSSINR